MFFFIFDPATGAIRGSMELPDGSAAPMPHTIECTAEQAANPIGYCVDVNATPIALEAIDPAVALATLRTSLADGIDNLVASIYATWTRFQTEYFAREDAANAFKAGGYVGDPGPWVTSYASAAGKGYIDATDTILAQAAGLRSALAQIGEQRMRKYEILKSSDASIAQTLNTEITTNIKAIAAAVQ
jgi:hypothetical protein